jgi:hypothetical protein
MCGIAPANVDDCGRFGDPACPYFGVGEPEPEGVATAELDALWLATWSHETQQYDVAAFARAVLARWGRPTIKPVPVAERLPGCVHERFEFSVFDSEYEEQAGGTAPTYAQALSEGQHYLAMYSQDGPHSLELRRVEVLIPDALPNWRPSSA